jgi:hypothetical protein
MTRYLLPVPLDPGTENTEAGFLIEESDPLDQAGDSLDGSGSFRDGSHLVGIILS